MYIIHFLKNVARKVFCYSPIAQIMVDACLETDHHWNQLCQIQMFKNSDISFMKIPLYLSLVGSGELILLRYVGVGEMGQRFFE